MNFFYFSAGVAVWVFTISSVIFVIIGIFLLVKVNQMSKRIKELRKDAEMAQEAAKYAVLSVLELIIKRLKKEGE